MSNRDITKSKGNIGEVGVVVMPDTVTIGIMKVNCQRELELGLQRQ
jgi:hypothetical protein